MQLPFAHVRFSRKPYYDVRQVLGTRVPNLKSIALLVRAVVGFHSDRQTDQCSKTTFSESAPSKTCRKHKISNSEFGPHRNTFITLYVVIESKNLTEKHT